MNLTEVVVRADDTYDSLKRKVELATILGTIQSTLTNFQFLSDEWKRQTEEERLLGVSLTGIMDNKLLSCTLKREDLGYTLPTDWTTDKLAKMLEDLRDVAKATNIEWAEKLGIQQSASITCVDQ